MQKMKPKLETIFCTFLDSSSSNKKDHEVPLNYKGLGFFFFFLVQEN